jgi:hypothetical protein
VHIIWARQVVSIEPTTCVRWKVVGGDKVCTRADQSGEESCAPISMKVFNEWFGVLNPKVYITTIAVADRSCHFMQEAQFSIERCALFQV